MIAPNDGQRPSRLQLDRLATGELDPDEARALQARLDGEARAHLAAVEAARSGVPPLDLGALRARAASLPPEAPAPANDARGFARFAPVLLLLAAALLGLLVLPRLLPASAPEGADTIGFRSGDALQVFQLQGRHLYPYAPGTPVGEGDLLGFEVNATGRRGVVLLSVDGAGTVSVFWPAEGESPEPLSGEGLVRLPDAIVLDDAPGPEVFVAVFDRPVSAARSELLRAWSDGGAAAVRAWADRAAGVDAVEVTRR